MSENDFKVDLDAVEAAALRGHALDFPETRASRAIDVLVTATAAVFNWIWLVLIVLIVINVLLRYVIGANFIALEEMQWHLYAVGFLLGLGYAVDLDAHVRVDVAAEHWPDRRRAWIELIGILFFLIPFVWIILVNAWPFVTRAYQIGEVSAAPGGLPFRWAIKAVILVAFVYLGLAVVSRLLRVCSRLFGRPRPISD